MKISAGNDKKRCSCECPEGRSFPHEGEVMPGIVPLGKLFFGFFWTFQQPKKQFYRKAAVISLPLALVPSGGANHRENNPAHIEVEEQTFDRAG